MAAADASSSVAPFEEIRYDVFLSFRGEDTRAAITSHLYKELCRRSIITYKDDARLVSGEEISSALLTAIRRSKISVVMFSERYASSWWCLDELVHILHCRKIYGQHVVPIFYHVDPSHVRNQIGPYAADLANLGQRFRDSVCRVNSWRSALKEAANLSGFHSKNSRTESDLVDEVVKDVLRKLKQVSSCYSKGLVGIESRVDRIESLLHLHSFDVRIIGIWGMGGIGKTTIARVVFERFSSKFDSCCFLENIREELEKPGGINHLRISLFSELLQEEVMNFGFSVVRSTSVRAILLHKKVLIVLDDVNQPEQLEILVGDLENYCPGSRIIITSRDLSVLMNATEDYHNIYQVKEFDSFESLQLFGFHAFKRSLPPLEYEGLSKSVVSYSQGLPLALKVLGADLYGKSSAEWESTLDKLERIPNNRILGVLRISFDGLDDEEKRMLLDIACFFKGLDVDYVVDILQGSGFSSVIGIKDLIDKSLIRVGAGKTLQMHDLERELCWEVVRKESFLDPGKSSRLCTNEGVCHVLEKNTGRENIEGIFYETGHWKQQTYHICEERYVHEDSFSKMYNLRLLKISYCYKDWCKCKFHLPNGLSSFPCAPSLFHWDEYPLKCFPSGFIPKNLVELRIPCSELERLWDGTQPLLNLKELCLYGSECLTEIPDLSLAPNLERMNLMGCRNLVKLPSSLQTLVNLVELDLYGCLNLKCLPTGMYKLRSLEDLNLSGCSKLETLTDILEPMHRLTFLYLSGTGIKELPSSIENLISLEILSLSHCENLEFVPESFCNLTSVRLVDFSFCSKLEKLPALPAHLGVLNVRNCTSLKSIGSLALRVVKAENCHSLEDVIMPSVRIFPAQSSLISSISFLNCLSMDENTCKKLIAEAQLRIGEGRDCVRFWCPGNEIPQLFNHQAMGSSINIEILDCKGICGLALSFVFNSNDCKGSNTYDFLGVHFKCKYKLIHKTYDAICDVFMHKTRPINSDYLFMRNFTFYERPCNFSFYERPCPCKASLTVYIENKDGKCIEGLKVKKIGVRLLYRNNQDMEKECALLMKTFDPTIEVQKVVEVREKEETSLDPVEADQRI